MAKFGIIDGGRTGPGGADSPLETPLGGGNNGGMDDLIRRVEGLERSLDSVKETLGRLEPRIIEMHSFATAVIPTLATKVDIAETKGLVAEAVAVIPTLATKADVADFKALLAEKPSKSYLWMVLGVLVATILGTIGVVIAVAPLLQKAVL
jgi:hypothetical protein